jgi:hypothetical protein
MPDMVHTTALHFYSTMSVHQPNDMKSQGTRLHWSRRLVRSREVTGEITRDSW